MNQSTAEYAEHRRDQAYRAGTFFGGGVVAHVSLADPTCGHLAAVLGDAARAEGARVHQYQTYICIEGPQFSTRAESRLFRRLGADVIGMTNVPEVKLAREAELCYATLALPTDCDSWRLEDEVRVRDVLATLRANVELAKRILAAAIPSLDMSVCGCKRALDAARAFAPSSNVVWRRQSARPTERARREGAAQGAGKIADGSRGVGVALV